MPSDIIFGVLGRTNHPAERDIYGYTESDWIFKIHVMNLKIEMLRDEYIKEIKELGKELLKWEDKIAHAKKVKEEVMLEHLVDRNIMISKKNIYKKLLAHLIDDLNKSKYLNFLNDTIFEKIKEEALKEAKNTLP